MANQKHQSVKFPNPSVPPRPSEVPSSSLGFGRAWLAALVVLAAAFVPSPALAQKHDVVLVLDNSGSMRRNDPDLLALLAIERLVSAQPADARVALLVFDETPSLVTPLAPAPTVRDRIVSELSDVTYRGRYTNLPSAIERAVYHLRLDGRPDARRYIVFLTDGKTDTGDRQRDADLDSWLQNELAHAAADEGIQFFGVAFTEQADFRIIESITRRTGGTHLRVFSAAELPAALRRIQQITSRPPERAEEPETAAAPAREQEPAPAEETATAAPAASVQEQGPDRYLWWGLVAAIPLLTLIALWLLYQIRQKGPASPVTVPSALLYDIRKVTGKPVHELGATTVIGRRPHGHVPNAAEIVIDHNRISRRHAVIVYRDGQFWLSDLGTRNGTYVNEVRISQETMLHHGDRVRFEVLDFEFQMPSSEHDVTKLSFEVNDEVTKLSPELSDGVSGRGTTDQPAG